jgi:hypothetical protein
MAIAKEAGEYVLRWLIDDPFSTRATRANRFASVSVPAATLFTESRISDLRDHRRH